jgi:thiol-disulfide isomerase/thioredoxin
MKSKLLYLASFLIAFSLVGAEPPPADELIAQAGKTAAAENKAIYVHFGASWCGWCKRHEAFLARPDIKPVFEKYFVPLKLVTQESDDHKNLENPGADQWLKKLGGPAGLPYSAFVNAGGELIVNSKNASSAGPGGGNVGHPMTPDEIDWFVAMMKKAAPAMSVVDLKTIEDALRSQKR